MYNITHVAVFPHIFYAALVLALITIQTPHCYEQTTS